MSCDPGRIHTVIVGPESLDIRPGRVRSMRLSARNQLAGTVTRVEHGAIMSTVVIQLAGGQEVVSAITKDSATALEIKEGDAVIKATDVMIGKE